MLVLIAENVGHVKSVALMTDRNLDKSMGRALLADGVATTLAGLGGGSGTTTYAENIGVMAATRVYSTAAYWVAGIIAILLGFSPKVGALIFSVPAGVLTGVLFVPGAWLIPLGFATRHTGVVQLGGVLATTAVCTAAWNLSRPLSATGKGAPIVGLRLAVAYLVVTAGFGVTYAFDRGFYWFPLLSDRVLAHAHLGLIGWLGLAYVAVAEKLWPMFLLAHRPHARAGERAVWLVGTGAPIVTLGLLFSSQPVTIVGGALVVAGLGFHLASLASVIAHRRRSLELLHGFVLASAAFLSLIHISEPTRPY